MENLIKKRLGAQLREIPPDNACGPWPMIEYENGIVIRGSGRILSEQTRGCIEKLGKKRRVLLLHHERGHDTQTVAILFEAQLMRITRQSPITGEWNSRDLPISEEQFQAWCNGKLIQDAMPHLSASDREFIISGATEKDWEIFENGDEA